MINNDLLFFCTMCRDKSPEEIAKIRCEITHIVKHYKRGEHIAYQGDRVQNLLMLTKGRVRTEIVSDSGLTMPMEDISAPYPLAAAFLFANDNHFPVDVTALEQCEVLFIEKSEIEEQIRRCPGFLRGFMAFNANRMLYMSERLKIFAQKGIKAKIAYYLLSHETKEGNFELGRSIASLADYFGVARPSLSRAMSELVGDNIIAFEAGQGTILNYNALKEFARG